MQSIGLIAGFFVSFVVLVPLVTWGIMDIGEFTLFTGLFIFGFGIVVLFYPETDHFVDSSLTMKEVCYTFAQFVENPNLRILGIFLITVFTPMEAILAIFVPIIIENGVSMTLIPEALLIVFPVICVIGYFVGRYLKGNTTNMEVYFYCYLAVGAFLVVPFLFIQNIQTLMTSKYFLLYLILGGTYIGGFAIAATISYNALILRITDESLASTFQTALYSLANFGRLWPDAVAFFLVQYISVTALFIFAIVWIAFYQWFFRKWVIPLDDLKPHDFGFYYHKHNELAQEEARDE